MICVRPSGTQSDAKWRTKISDIDENASYQKVLITFLKLYVSKIPYDKTLLYTKWILIYRIFKDISEWIIKDRWYNCFKIWFYEV